MDALVDSSSATARSTSSCVPRPATNNCCVSSDALSWLATLSRATASRACVPLTSVYARTTSAATDTRVRRRSDRSRTKSARAAAMEARRAPKTSTSQLASTPASNRFTSNVGATPICDRLRSNAAVAPPTGQFAPSCSRCLARASLTSAVAWRTSGLRPSACSTSDVMRASWNVVHHASTGSVVASAVSVAASKVAAGNGATGLMSVPLTLQAVVATNTAPMAACARRITTGPRPRSMC